jgi:lysophospholipase L1-like esterase
MTGARLPGPQLPWPEQRRPLSVVAFGNSVASLIMPERTDRSEGTYLEVLADVLAGMGVPAIPHQESRWFGFLHAAMRDYVPRVRAHSPDVLVVQFGLNEYQPWIVPIWLVRHLLTQGEAVSRVARRYRRHVGLPLWKLVRGFRRRVSPLVGMRTWQTTPRRFEGQLRKLLRVSRRDTKCLVLVLDIDRPGPVLQHFLPGVDARHAVFQEILERVVREVDDPEVRLFRVSEVTAGIGPEAMQDSMHYTAATHRVVGEALAAEVADWLRTRAAQG